MIVDKFYVGESKPWSAFPRGVLRMSGAEMCTRRAGYQYLKFTEDPEPVEGMNDFRAVVLEEGNLHELEVVRRVQMKFRAWNFGSAQIWTTFKSKNLIWRGHPDLFVEIDGKTYGTEIKSTRDSLFSKYAAAAEEVLPGRYLLYDQTVLHDSTFPYMGQIQLYLHSDKIREMGVEEWILIVKNRDTGSVLECNIKKDPEYLEEIVNRWRTFWSLMSVERLPDRNFEKGSQQCSFCPFQERCWGAMQKLPGKSLVLNTDKLVQAARIYREGKEFEKKAKIRLELSKLQFENAAIDNKTNRLFIDDLDIKISDRAREGLDSDNVESLLGRLLKEEKITPQEVESCFRTTEYSQMNIVDKRTK